MLSIFADSFRDEQSSQALLGAEIALTAHVDGKAGSLIVSIRRFVESPPLTEKRRVRKLTTAELAKVRSEIERVLADGVRLPAVAATMALSPSQFSRVFHASVGETFSSYVLHMRLDAAMRMMNETAHPLYHIAMESGFGDQSTFTRAFKKFAGVSPFKWRLLANDKFRTSDAIEHGDVPC